MTIFDSERNPVEVLADEFTSRCRRGECPSITEYVKLHPDLADEIRELFPSIAMIEQLGRKEHGDREFAKSQTAFKTRPIERIGDFRIIREIGRGGMGVVYEAEQESLGRRVAVKVLTASAVSSPRQLQRFTREAQAAASLHHSNIVPVFGVGEDDGLHYYVMQAIDGVGLDVIIAELRRWDAQAMTNSGGTTEPGSVSAIAAAEALRVGHFSQSRSSRAHSDSHHASRESTITLSGQSNSSIESATDQTEGDTQSLPQPAQLDSDSRAGGDTPAAPQGPSIQAGETKHLGDRYWKSVATIGVQLADAVQYAHGKGVLHRDLKPSNLLLDRRGTAWITDFGLAKHSESDELTNTGDIIGTLKYMAPEQFDGQSSTRSDIYSLGLTLYELITLEPAVNESDRNRLIKQVLEGEPTRPRHFNPRIPLDLETIVLKSIAREASHRYESAAELADDLQRFLDDEPIRARPVTVPERLWRWCRRNPAVATWAGIALSLLVLVAVVASAGYVQTTNALKRETASRAKAEATLEISLEALDKVYERFSPERLAPSTQLTIEDEDGEEFEVSAPPVLSQQTAELLEGILKFYDRFAEQDSDNVKLRREAAKANRRVGDIQQQLGQFDQAEAAYLRAIGKYQQLADDPSTQGQYQLEIARIGNELGNVYRAQYKFDEARKSFDQALESLQRIATAPSPPRDARFELARTHYLLGRLPPDWLVFSAGRPPMHFGAGPGSGPIPGSGPSTGPDGPPREGPPREGSEGPRPTMRPPNRDEGSGPPVNPFAEFEIHLKSAIEILEQLTTEFPKTADYQHLLALCYRDRMSRHNSEGIDKAIEILQRLADEHLNVPEYRFDLSSTYATSSFRFSRREDDTSLSSQDRLAKATAISRQLTVEHPHVPRYTALHANNCSKMASTLRWQIRPTAAGKPNQELERVEQFHREALTGLATLVERFPDVLIYKISLAREQESLADYLRLYHPQPQSLAEARTLLEKSIAHLNQPSANEWDARMLKYPLAESYRTMSEVLRLMGEEEKANEFAALAGPQRPFGPGPPKWRGGRRDRGENDVGSKPGDKPTADPPSDPPPPNPERKPS